MYNCTRADLPATARLFSTTAKDSTYQNALKLAQANYSGKTLSLSDGPDGPNSFLVSDQSRSLHESYTFQNVLIREMEKHGESVKGWKVGATNSALQQRMGIPEPMKGPIFRKDLVFCDQKSSSNPDYVENAKILTTKYKIRGIELEYAFVMSSSFPGRPSSTPESIYSMEEIMEHISAVVPAIEIVGSRVASGVSSATKEPLDLSTFGRISDQAMHGALILPNSAQFSLGRSAADSTSPKQESVPVMSVSDFLHYLGADKQGLLSSATSKALPTATLSINNTFIASGTARDVLDSPFLALQWIINKLAFEDGVRRGYFVPRSNGNGVATGATKDSGEQLGPTEHCIVSAGHVVTTGTMTGLVPIGSGDEAIGDFSGWGKIGVRLE